MRLVENEPKYYNFILELRNNVEVKKGFIKQDAITPTSHEMFMQQYGACFYVCLLDDIPVGFVGNIDNDVRVATLPGYQGKGVGTFMISELIKKFPDAEAKVKVENVASLRLFEKCGFEKKYYILERK